LKLNIHLNFQHKKYTAQKNLKIFFAQKSEKVDEKFSIHDNDVFNFEEREAGIIFLCSLQLC